MSPITCDCNVIHTDAVENVSKKMPMNEDFQQVSEFFKVFSDPTRAKIIWALDQEELCVCDLSNVLNMTKSAVSHQLGILRAANLVKYRRDGKNVFYSLQDDHVRSVFEAAFDHIHE